MKFITNILLFPLALIYGAIIWCRNWLYKTNFIGSTDFEMPVFTIGNLSVGGTGKTPFVEMLIEFIQPYYNVAVLSRGYKRKTTGYVAVQPFHTSKDVGDEPLMIKLKYPNVQVVVGEERVIAIPKLISEQPQTQVILLDDAFQHQSVRPDINILLTTYDKPFYKDKILPLGTLREFESGKNRANIIVVTKCPKDLSEQEQQEITSNIKPNLQQKLFFSTIDYGFAYNILNPMDRLSFSKNDAQLLITGIANADLLKQHVEDNSKDVVHFSFADHHQFEQYELENIIKHYPTFTKWMTTEKDGVRLALHKNWLINHNISVYCLPIKTRLIGKNIQEFNSTIKGFLDFFYKDENEVVEN